MSSALSALLICFSLATPVVAAQVSFETVAIQAEAARTQNRVPNAIRLYREGTHMRPAWAEGWWYLGSLLYDQNRFPEATFAFQHLLGSTSHGGPVHAFLGLCEYGTGDYDNALAQFRAWASSGWPGPPALRDVAIYHFALLLTRDGKFVESLYLIAPLARRLGDNPDVAEAMGLASLRLRYLPENYPPEMRERIWLAGEAALYASQSPKDFQRADDFAARLESHYGTQPNIHYFRGTLYSFEDKIAYAEREYREELNFSPRLVPCLTALAAIDLDKDNLAEANLLARRAVDIDPMDAEAHHLLGRVSLAKGDLKASLIELKIAKQLAPRDPEVRAHLAMVYGQLGRMKEAKAESAAFLALKSKEDLMEPVRAKPGKSDRRKSN